MDGPGCDENKPPVDSPCAERAVSRLRNVGIDHASQNLAPLLRRETRDFRENFCKAHSGKSKEKPVGMQGNRCSVQRMPFPYSLWLR